MASGSANAAYHSTLAANTADTVSLGKAGRVSVVNRGGTELYFNVNAAAAPTVGGADCFVVPANSSWALATDATRALTVQVISSAAIAYSVQV